MSITIAKLEILARHFRFDINEARSIIGLPNKSEKKSYDISGFVSAEKSKAKLSSTIKSTSTVKSSKSTSTVRGPTGYNLYVKNAGISFKNAGSAWKNLSQSEKDSWNRRAKSI